MKNLANCTPREFLKQVMKLKKPLMQWYNDVGVAEIRKRMPDGFESMSDKEKMKALEHQSIDNMGDILASAIEKNFDSTIEVMCLCCFVDPKDVDTHPMHEYLESIMEIMNSEDVRNFFMFYMRPTH